MATKKTGEPRLRKQELFRAIGYVPHGVQVDVHRSSARLRVLACGTRYGKSTCAAAEVVAALLQPARKSLGWVVGPNLEVTNRVIERVRIILHEHFPRRIEKDQDREKRILIRNLSGGISELRGKSADATSSLLGAELDWLVIDECANVRRSAWEEHLSARLLDRRGWALLVGTPGKMDWFFELFRRGQDGSDPDCKSWRAPTWDNPHVQLAAIEAERARLPEEAFELQYAARFVLEPPTNCACCGFPSPTTPKWMFVDREYRLLRCRLCRNLVGAEGKTLVHRRGDGVLVAYALVDGVPDEDYDAELDAACSASASSAGALPATA